MIPFSIASAFGRATPASICNHYGVHQAYTYAESFIKCKIIGRYLLMESTVYRPLTHATNSRTRVTIARLLMDSPELSDIPHFIPYYPQQVNGVHSTFMIVVQHVMRLQHDRTTRFHATLATVKTSPYATAILEDDEWTTGAPKQSSLHLRFWTILLPFGVFVSLCIGINRPSYLWARQGRQLRDGCSSPTLPNFNDLSWRRSFRYVVSKIYNKV
jgi:hypothetical protein